MIAFEEAQKRALDVARVLEPEERGILEAMGMVLAEDVVAAEEIPSFDNSAMDGYAVRSDDLRAASAENPVTLRVSSDLPAGEMPVMELKKGEAVRIMTGAPIPKAADAVVIQEKTEQSGELVRIMASVSKGENIRPRAEDIRKGETVLKKGKLLNPADIGVLASLGRSRVSVTRRPRVAVLATGNEIVEISESLREGRVRNSNKYSLMSVLRSYGALPHDLGIARDDKEETKKKLREGLASDILVSIGGVSVGKYDFVRELLAELGVEIEFWKVAIKPGKPLLLGRLKETVIFGLPGNPVSCLACSELFVKPVVWKMRGVRQPEPMWVEAELRRSVQGAQGRVHLVTASTELEDGKFFATPTFKQGSGKLSSLSCSNSLILVPQDRQELKEHERVKVVFLEGWSSNHTAGCA